MKVLQICAKRVAGLFTRPARNIEGNNFAHEQTATFDDQLGAEIKDTCSYDLIDELSNLARGVAEAQDAKARGHVTGEYVLSSALHLGLDRHRLRTSSIPVTLSTRKAWFSAPRWNFSASRCRNSGVTPIEIAIQNGKEPTHDPGQ